VFAFVRFRCYLQNSNVETEVFTDHQSLQALLKIPKPEGPIAKHIMYLAQFRFNIKYRSSRSNRDADGLSRALVDSPHKSVDELVDEVFPGRIDPSTGTLNTITTRAQVSRQEKKEQSAKETSKITSKARALILFQGLRNLILWDSCRWRTPF